MYPKVKYGQTVKSAILVNVNKNKRYPRTSYFSCELPVRPTYFL